MRLREPLLAVLICGFVSSAYAQNPDAYLQEFKDREQARVEAREAEILQKLSPADRDKLRRLRVASAKSRRHIDGKATPELVPYQVRMQHFFHGYDQVFKNQLTSKLSPADLGVLAEFSARHSAELRALESTARKAWLQVEPLAKDMSAIEIAGAMKRESDRSEVQQASMYRKVIQQLSPQGQTVVNDFAFIHVRPQVTIVDPLVEAGLEPELFREQVLARSEARRAGKRVVPTLPAHPDVPKPAENGPRIGGQ